MTTQRIKCVFTAKILCCSFGVVVCVPAPAVAHHSRAAFDTTVEVFIEGVVSDVTWANPHVYLTLEVEGSDGARTMQLVEVGPLSTLGPLGLNRDALIRGERVTVRANPNRRGQGHAVVGLDVTRSDGSIYPLHVSGRYRPPPPAQRADSLAGKWVPTAAGWLSIVQGSRNWPLTEVGRQGVADTVSQQASQAECAPWPAPVFMAFPALLTVDPRPDVVTMRFDWMNGERTIHMNLTEHPAGLAPTLQGHSIGRWEGATLVIDTVGFAPHREGAGFTIEDPLSLAESVMRSVQWNYRPELEPSGQRCDPEIATRFLRE